MRNRYFIIRNIGLLLILLSGFFPFELQAQDQNLNKIVLSNHQLTLCENGESFQLNVGYIPAMELSPALNWESTDSEVAYVDQNGMVTPLKPGVSQIIVTTEPYLDQIFADTCHIYVGINPIGKSLIIQKWNNTLILNNNPATNGGYKFSQDSYQWYADSTPIFGATEQSYSAGSNSLLSPYAKYSVAMLGINGESLSTCPVLINLSQTPVLKVYPNPALKGQSIQIEFNLTEKESGEGNLRIYTMQGTLVDQLTVSKETVTIQAPATPGHYLIQLKIKGQSDQEYKMWVK